MEKLTHIEKIHIRALVVKAKAEDRNADIMKHLHIREALLTANGGKTSISERKLKIGKTLARNCFPRGRRSSFFVPVHFKTRLYTANESLSPSSIKVMQEVYRRRGDFPEIDLQEYLAGASGKTWRLPVQGYGMSTVVTEVRGKLLQTLLEADVCTRNIEKKEAVRSAFHSIKGLPSIVTFVKYPADGIYGAPVHVDTDSIFGSVIVILKDTPIGRLHVRGFDMPEGIQSGSIVVLNPTTMHEVAFANRVSSRIVLTFNF